MIQDRSMQPSITPAPEDQNDDQNDENSPPEWREQALWDLANTSLSYADIGRKYGRARDTIVKLKNQEGLVRPQKAKSGPKPVLGNQFISPQHRALATAINQFSDENPTRYLVNDFGVSPQVLKKLKHGCHDASLTLLLKISEVMEEPVGNLIDPKRARFKAKG